MFAHPWKSPAPFAVGSYVRGPALGQAGPTLEDRLFTVRDDLDRLQASVDWVPQELQQPLMDAVSSRWESCEDAYQAAKAAPDEQSVTAAETCVAKLKVVIQAKMKELMAPGGPPTPIKADETQISLPAADQDAGKTPESSATKIATVAGISVFAAILLYAIAR